MQHQGTHRHISAPFFAAAPVAVLGAGLLLLSSPGSVLRSNWAPATLALTHIGTLAFLGMVMLGLAYQATLRIGGPLRGGRLPHIVFAFLCGGVAFLVWALLAGNSWVVIVCLTLLAAAVLAFIAPNAWALRNIRGDPIASGIRIALGSLLLTAALGLWMVHGHGGMRFPGPRGLWVQVHLSVALLGWVGGLLGSLAWARLQPPPSPDGARLAQRLLVVGVTLPVLVLVLRLTGVAAEDVRVASRLALIGALPGGIAVWALLPFQALRARARGDDGLERFFDTGFALAPLTGLLALGAYGLDGPHWVVLLGWFAIWGWAGLLVHGLLLRAVQEMGGGVGRPTGTSFALHVAALIAGAVAVPSGLAWLVGATGLLLVATGLELGRLVLPGLVRSRAAGPGSSSR